MHHTPTTPDRLSNQALEVAIRDAIAEARRRPTMRPALRQILVGELEELKLEALFRPGTGPDPKLDPEMVLQAIADTEMDPGFVVASPRAAS